MRLFNQPKRSPVARTAVRPAPQAVRFRPCLEGLEDRVVPAAVPVIPLNITGISVQNGALLAQGAVSGPLGTQTFTTPITVTAAQAADSTPILNLHLAPIDLNLLGLQVDTSQICLDITAHSGPGRLLGNLVTDVANLLNGGLSLGNILGQLTATQTAALTGGLTTALQRSFRDITTHSVVTHPAGTSPAAPPGADEILHLSLGPVDLNVLGLEVKLDNCAGGPITVDVSAVPGPGNLLGNLLDGVVHLLDQFPNVPALDRLLTRIEGDILRLA
jgi:hypothetical protein